MDIPPPPPGLFVAIIAAILVVLAIEAIAAWLAVPEVMLQ